MVPIIVDRDSAPPGAWFRRSLPGPELDLVEQFISMMPLVHAPDSRVTVLREPSLESGFPDLVIVVWRSLRTAGWGDARMALVPDDLRLMQFLHQRRRASQAELAEYFGTRRTRGAIARLSASAMIRLVGQMWSPCALERSFAATKIIAVEAKIGNWNDVLNQARLNTWFASKSYVLVPQVSDDQLASAKNLGIGVLSAEGGKINEWPSASMPLPRSYASWLINDLAWRASNERSGLRP